MMRMSMPLAPATTAPKRRASTLRETLIKTWQGVQDGVRAARAYERLSAMSDAELARRGLSREEVLRAAMFGAPGEEPERRAHFRFGR
jgi:uncharacterized protein YjiS (DUF1127 family)